MRLRPAALRCCSAVLLALALSSSSSSIAHAADEPGGSSAGESDATLDPLRERFKTGMDRYRAGAFAEAIVIWDKIYRELGNEKGYRLAFNLARAFEQLAQVQHVNTPAAQGDLASAAEYFAAYVRQTMRKRAAEEPLEPLIEKQEGEAKERLGLIKIASADPAGNQNDVVHTSIDGVDVTPADNHQVWVSPSPAKHAVVFRGNTPDEKRAEVTVEAKKELIVQIPALERRATPIATTTIPAQPKVRWETREKHPYSATVVYVGAGITALSLIVPAIFYANAGSIEDDYNAAPANGQDALKSDYNTARDTAYASWVIPSVLGAVTIGLAAYWYFGKKEIQVPVPTQAKLGATGLRF